MPIRSAGCAVNTTGASTAAAVVEGGPIGYIDARAEPDVDVLLSLLSEAENGE